MMRYAPFSEGQQCAARRGVTPMNAGSDPAWEGHHAVLIRADRVRRPVPDEGPASGPATGIGATAGYIASAGFPFPLFLTWCAAIFELLLVLAFLSGAFSARAALLAALYVVFLAFAFHGPRAGARTSSGSSSSAAS